MPTSTTRRQLLTVVTASTAVSALTSCLPYEVRAQQPHMEAALGHLQSAYAELEKADHNKGGHRVKAMELIQGAIAEVQRGLAAGS